MSKPQKESKKPFYRKPIVLWTLGGIVGVVLAILLAFRLSPFPGAMVIRYVFNQGGAKTAKALDAHHPAHPVSVIPDQQYQTGDKNARLDVYYPSATPADKHLPVVIWTHGGAWLSGNKKDSAAYFKLIADAGYVVVAPNYALAPGSTYPTPIHQLNRAHAFVVANADRFHADTNQIVLAGDSAGAQLSAQMATIITNPEYAHEVGIVPALQPSQLKGVVLNCGIYKMDVLAEHTAGLPKLIGWGDDVTVWAYAGTHNFADPIIRQMSPFYHVTKDFPPAYITGGNGDALTNVQSKPLAQKLQSLGVEVKTHFFAADYYPLLPHEYQFNLDTSDGQKALQVTLDFLRHHTKVN